MKKSTALSIILYALPFSSVILQIQVYHTEENYSRRKRPFMLSANLLLFLLRLLLSTVFTRFLIQSYDLLEFQFLLSLTAKIPLKLGENTQPGKIHRPHF